MSSAVKTSDKADKAMGVMQGRGLDFLARQREGAEAAWAAGLKPGRKSENWRYTSLAALEKDARIFAAQAGVDNRFIDDDVYLIPGLQSIRLVFVDGHFRRDLSACEQSELPEGLSLALFSEADETQKQIIEKNFGSLFKFEQHPFAALNTARMQEGVLLQVEKRAVIDPVLHIVHVSSSREHAHSYAPRLLLNMAANSQINLLEHYVSIGRGEHSFSNAVSECFVGDGAQLRHYRVHTEGHDATHIGGLHIRLGRNAQLQSFHLALGALLQRIDMVVHHLGEGAHCDINGIYLPNGKKHVDYHTCLEHTVPHCTSNEVFRGIVGDSARAVFNGRIHIHKHAQKTDARLSNRNLLTSQRAEVDTKPELEIYADDVQCAHGATVAQLDNTALHYLRSRGLSTMDAEVLLSFAFINELLDGISNEAIAVFLREKVRSLFSRESSLVSHQS